MSKQVKTYRKFVGAAVSTALVTTAVAPAYAAYTDVGGQYTDAVSYLVDSKITDGLTGTTFGTHHTIKRVDAAVMLAKALELDVSQAGSSGFTDVPLRAEPYIAALKKAGYIQGKTATSFGAQSELQRGEAAIMLTNAFGLEGSMDRFPFTDVADRYVEAVDRFLANGITVGKGPTKFGTSDSILRGEYAVFLYKLSQVTEVEEIRNELEATISAAEDLLEEPELTDDDRKALEEAIDDAKEVVADEDATKEELENALDDLDKVVDEVTDNLEDSEDNNGGENPGGGGGTGGTGGGSGGGSSGGGGSGGGGGGGGSSNVADETEVKALENSIAEAEALLKNTEVGDKNGQVSKEAADALAKVVEEAKAVTSKNRPTKKEVTDAKNKLDKTIKDFKEAIVKGDAGSDNEQGVNTGVLAAALKQAKTLKEDDYTSTSWADLQTAITEGEAVLDNEQPTQREVDEALAKLHEAIQKLELKQDGGEETSVNKSALEAAIKAVQELDGNKYTVDSWTKTEQALENAESINESTTATQTEVDQAVKSLHGALEGLVSVEGLQELIDEAQNLLKTTDIGEEVGQVSQGAYEALEAAKNAAQTVRDKSDATKTEIANAQTKLGQAITDFKDAIVKDEDGSENESAVNTDVLKEALKQAKTLEETDYIAGTWTDLQQAITDGEAVLEKEQPTQEEIDTALTNLHKAIRDLEMKQDGGEEVAVNKSALDAAITAAGKLEEENYTDASWSTFAEALEKANVVSQDENANQEAVDEALKELQDSIEGLELETDQEVAEVNKNALNAAIEEAETLLDEENKDKYTDGSFNDALAKLETAKGVSNNDAATQGEVDTALKDLQTSIEELVLEEGEEAEVNKEALVAAIETADKLQESDYTPESWNALVTELDNAKSVQETNDATQETVDDAVEKLHAAIQGLDLVTEETPEAIVNKDALISAIATAEVLVESDYTAGTWTALQTQLSTAKDVNDADDSTQETIDQAVQELHAAIQGLELAKAGTPSEDVDKSGLLTAINTAEALEAEAFTSASWTALQTALETAKSVHGNEGATQEDIDGAIQSLHGALEGLVAIDKLQASIDEATNLLENTEVGFEAGQVSQEAYDALEAARNAAQDVLDQDSPTKSDVANAKTTLDDAIADFNDAIVGEDGGSGTDINTDDLKEAVEKAEGLLGNDELDETIKGDLQEKVDDANKVLEKVENNDEDVTQEDVDNALENLNNEIEKAEEAISPPADETDISALENSIEQATNLLGNTDVGTGDGEVSQGAYDALEEARDAAQNVIGKDNPTKKEVTDAKTTLDQAIADFNDAIVGKDGGSGEEVDISELAEAVGKAEELVDSEELDEETKTELNNAIQNAKDVLEKVKNDEDVSQEDVNTALKDLNDAIEKAEEVINPPAGEEDKSALEDSIREATNLLGNTDVGTEDGDVSQGAYDALEAARNAAQGVLDQDSPTKSDVANAKETLDDAIADFNDAIVGEDGDTDTEINTSVLAEAIKQAKDLMEDNYTSDSWTNLQTAIENGESVLEKNAPTQAEVDEALTNLHQAIQNLELNPGEGAIDKSALEAAINTANGLKEDEFTSASWANLQTALEVAEGVRANEEATQDEVDNAVKSLHEALENLDAINLPAEEADKSALQDSINEATELLKTEVGSGEGQVSEEAYDALEEARNTAQDVLKKDNLTTGEVADAKTVLDVAIDDFNGAIVGEDGGSGEEADGTELEAAIEKAEDLLTNENVSGETKDTLQAKTDAATDIVKKLEEGNDEITQEQVDKALEELDEAIDAAEEQAKATALSKAEKAVDAVEEAVEETAKKETAYKNVKDDEDVSDKDKDTARQEYVEAQQDEAEKFDEAKKLVDALADDVEEKQDLQDRLDKIKVDYAEKYVKQAEVTITQAAIDTARDYVSKLQDGEEKEEFDQRLNQVATNLKTINTARTAVRELEQATELDDEQVSDAREKVAAVGAIEVDGEKVREALAKTLSDQIDNVVIDFTKKELKTQLDAAKAKQEDVKESADGSDILEDEEWVTPEAAETFQEAIDAAQGEYDNSDATLDSVESAVTDLEAAIDAYDPQGGKLSLEDAAKNAVEDVERSYDSENQTHDQEIYVKADELVKSLESENGDTAEGLRDRLKEVKTIIDAEAAVADAETRKTVAAIEQAQELINQITEDFENVNAQDAKQDLQERLTDIEQGTHTLADLREQITIANQHRENHEIGNVEYEEAALNTLTQALEAGENLVKEHSDEVEGDDYTNTAITEATNDLIDAIDRLIDITPPTLKPDAEQENSQKEVNLNLKPEINTPGSSKKVSGGVVGLDIGIVDLGLISSSQISSLTDNNVIDITVNKNTTLDADLSVAIHTVLGGQAFDVGVYKKEENGDYKRIDILSGSSGGALGIAKVERFTLDTLEEGEYKFILDLGAGLAVVQVAPFEIYNKVEKDYSQVAKDVKAEGNVLADWYKGGNNEAIVSDVEVIGKEDTLTEISAEPETDKGTSIQGQYGKLFMKQDGSYTYEPANDATNVGKIEKFKYTVLNTYNGEHEEGELKIRISGDTIKWEGDNWEKPQTIIEAVDKKANTSISAKNKTDVVTVKNVRSGASRWYNNTITTDTFTIQDKKSVLELDYRKSLNIGNSDAKISLIKIEDGEEIEVESHVRSFSTTAQKLTFANLEAGEYKLTAKGVNSMGARTGYLQNIKITSPVWGEYDVAEPKEVTGNLKVGATLSEAEGVETELSVLGQLIDENGRVSSGTAYHRFSKLKDTITLSGKYGVLTVEKDGTYTYRPNADVSIAGGTEEFTFKFTHASGLFDEATLSISIDPLLDSTEGDDILVGTVENDTIEGKGGSDTLVYGVHEEDATGGNGHDTWTDFHYGTVAVDGDADRLDLRLLFEDEDITTSNIGSYLELSKDRNSMTIKVDRDGKSGSYKATDLITLNIDNPDDLPESISIKDLIDKGMLIVQ